MNLRAGVYGGAFGVAILPGDRLRRSHDAVKDRVFVDIRTLGTDILTELYSLFTHHHSAEGRTAYEKPSELEHEVIQTDTNVSAAG